MPVGFLTLLALHRSVLTRVNKSGTNAFSKDIEAKA